MNTKQSWDMMSKLNINIRKICFPATMKKHEGKTTQTNRTSTRKPVKAQKLRGYEHYNNFEKKSPSLKCSSIWKYNSHLDNNSQNQSSHILTLKA